ARAACREADDGWPARRARHPEDVRLRVGEGEVTGMPLCLVRIDDRLVHGQVVAGWLPHVRAELVLVACDAAADDEIQGTLMRLALPDAVALEVLTLAAAARHPARGADFLKKTMLLAPVP